MSAETLVRVEVPGHAYDVHIGRGLLGEVGEVVVGLTAARQVALVTDETVGTLFGAAIAGSVERAGAACETVVVPPGEASKSWEQAGVVLETLAELGLDRSGVVVAVGGGVVGDLAGFCAAAYMRGIRLVHVPTTLLAQVDSSIGGKTAVDLRAGKNLAGAFIQPAVVISDTSTLGSLSEGEWRSGLAEVAKSAVLDGERFLSWIEANASALLRRDPDIVEEAVRSSVAFKARVVSSDEKETGLREILNLGHTFGHAMEKVAGYGAIPHGVAVADGMRFAARLAERLTDSSPEFTARQERLLDALGLTRTRAVYDVVGLRAAISSDKKTREGQPRFVLAHAPGEIRVEPVAEDALMETLAAFAAGEDETT